MTKRSWRTLVLACVSAVTVLALAGCSGEPKIFQTRHVATDRVPAGISSMLQIDPASTRHLVDTDGIQFYAARPATSSPDTDMCLTAIPNDNVNASSASCGRAGDFSMTIGDLTAKVMPDGVQGSDPAGWEKKGDYLLVHHDG